MQVLPKLWWPHETEKEESACSLPRTRGRSVHQQYPGSDLAVELDSSPHPSSASYSKQQRVLHLHSPLDVPHQESQVALTLQDLPHLAGSDLAKQINNSKRAFITILDKKNTEKI